MNKPLYITILEKDNQESPNIGTIYHDRADENVLMQKLIRSIESHFDAEVENVKIQDDLPIGVVRNGPPLDVTVTIDGMHYNIEIQETWLM